MTTVYDIENGMHHPDTLRSRLQNYMYQNCSNPVEVVSFDPVKGTRVLKKFSCGKCWHCTQAKSQDLVTRFYLHKQDWKFVYFVTLTYDSIDAYPTKTDGEFVTITPKDEFLREEFALTGLHYDAENKTHHLALHPCLLTREHLKNYIKRLRASLPKGCAISYYAVGEYGHKYGRPHYHLVVFCKQPIDITLFPAAWGKKVYLKGRHYLPYRGQADVTPEFLSFGDVDVTDLLHPKSYKSNESLSLVFKYVAKYVNKNQSKNDDFSFNLLRVNKYFSTFADEIKKQRYYYECNYIKSLADNPLNVPVAYSYNTFVRKFSPFALQSCSYAIGKDYLLAHLDGLANGLEKLPAFEDISVRFPSYYTRKIQDYIYSLRLVKSCRVSTPTGESNILSFTKGSLPYVFGALAASYVNVCPTPLLQSSLLYSFGRTPTRFSVINPPNMFLHDVNTKQTFFYNSVSCLLYTATCKPLNYHVGEIFTDYKYLEKQLRALSQLYALSITNEKVRDEEDKSWQRISNYLQSINYSLEQALQVGRDDCQNAIEAHQRLYLADKETKKSFVC